MHQNRKMTAVLGFMALVSLACLLLMLLALYLYLLSQASYHNDLLASTKQKYQTADFLKYKSIITDSNKVLVKVDTFYKNQIHFADALKVVSAIARPQNLRVKNITMEPAKNGLVKVDISGVSDTRESLLAFKQAIESEPMVASSHFPPDNWIKPKDINFYLTLEIKLTGLVEYEKDPI